MVLSPQLVPRMVAHTPNDLTNALGDLAAEDSEVHTLISAEAKRQRDGLELIASENFALARCALGASVRASPTSTRRAFRDHATMAAMCTLMRLNACANSVHSHSLASIRCCGASTSSRHSGCPLLLPLTPHCSNRTTASWDSTCRRAAT